MKKVLIAIMVMAAGIAYAVDVEPPLEFTATPVKTALDTVFMKAGNVAYSYEISQDVGTVDLKLTERTELEALLKLILEPKGLVFEKDAGGVYHIKKPQGGEGVM